MLASAPNYNGYLRHVRDLYRFYMGPGVLEWLCRLVLVGEVIGTLSCCRNPKP